MVIPQNAVKICGLRRPEDARTAVEAGADLLGFIFAPARRQVDVATAAACIAEARRAARGRLVLAVGVFVNASIAELTSTADGSGLDLLQLHGEESLALIAALDRPVIKGLRPTPGSPADDVLSEVARFAALNRPPVAYLIDGYDPRQHGGTGVRADWTLAARLAGEVPLVLAGGMSAENVGEAIAAVRPLAVDVSSGVETEGAKDAVKIAAFVRSAKEAFGGPESATC